MSNEGVCLDPRFANLVYENNLEDVKKIYKMGPLHTFWINPWGKVCFKMFPWLNLMMCVELFFKQNLMQKSNM